MDLKQIRDLCKTAGFRPNKRLGQNFMVDNNTRKKIISSIRFRSSDTVVEIGAGFGAMTFLLAECVKKVIAVEKVARVYEIMKPIFQKKENIVFMNEDILKVDLERVRSSDNKLTVFGNIPYYISTPVIEKIIDQRAYVESAYIVMQEELADRIVASPGTRTAGSISYFVQFYTKPKKLFRIKKNVFYPKPQVESCLLELEVLSSPSVKVRNESIMFQIIRRAFSERRKMAINPLSSSGLLAEGRSGWERIFNKCQLDKSSRAENLSLKDYSFIADELYYYKRNI